MMGDDARLGPLGSGPFSWWLKSAIISPLGDETFSDGRQKVVVYIYMNADEASLVFFCISEDGVFFIFDAGATAGSGSCEAAHPSLSLHIRTVCTRTFKCVTPSMQSGCHAASSCYTSVESANLLPHVPANAHARVAHLCGIWAVTLSFSPWWS